MTFGLDGQDKLDAKRQAFVFFSLAFVRHSKHGMERGQDQPIVDAVTVFTEASAGKREKRSQGTIISTVARLKRKRLLHPTRP